MKYGILLLLCIFAINAYSYRETSNVAFPKGCRSIGFERIKNRMEVMLYNLSDNDVWVTYIPKGASFEAEKSVRLKAHHWSTFVHGKDRMRFLCTESRPGHEQQVPCSSVITTCSLKGRKSSE